MKHKPLVISIIVILVLGCLGLLAVVALHSIIVERVSEKLTQKATSLGLHVDVVPASILAAPNCLETIRFQGADSTEIVLTQVCLDAGLETLRDETPTLVTSCQRISGRVSRDFLQSLKTPQNDGVIASTKSLPSGLHATLQIEKIDVSLGDRDQRIAWKAAKTRAVYDRGRVSLDSTAPLTLDIQKSPVAFRNMPQIHVTLDVDMPAKIAKLHAQMTPAMELGVMWNDGDYVIALESFDMDLAPDKPMNVAISNVAITSPELWLPNGAKIETLEAQLTQFPPSRENLSGIRAKSPSLSIDLQSLLRIPQIQNSPVVGALVKFWKKEAGSFLGKAPKASVRKADIENNHKKRKVIKTSPISPEQLKSVRDVFDRMQQKIAKLPSIDIEDGHIDIVHNGEHYDFNAISFDTAELFKDSQKFELHFHVRQASAHFLIDYREESPYPTVEFDIDQMASADFLHVLNLPIPEKNEGTFSMALTASLSDRDFTLKGNISLSDFAFYHEKMSPNLIEHIEVSTTFDAQYDFSTDHLKIQPLSMTSGPISADGFFEITQVRSDPTIKFEIGAKDIPCEDIPKAIPQGFLPTITDLRITGTTISPKFKGIIPWKAPLESTIDATGFDGNTCYPISVAPHMPEILNSENYAFTTHYTYFTDAITVGPGTDSYVPLRAIPPYVTAAMFLTEDKRMFEHGPLRMAFIERAMRLNLNARKYVYGGSTILQQLTKNLFLSRTKNLARKIEEAFIAWRIDAVVPKTRVMELYINMIEFGPDIYGIQSAAAFYFNKTPMELTPVEGAFLAALKISPSVGGKIYRQGGVVKDSWWHKKIRQIQDKLAENGYISVHEAIAGYPWLPEFYYPEDPEDYRNVWKKNYDDYQKEQTRLRRQKEAEARKAEATDEGISSDSKEKKKSSQRKKK